MNYVPDFCHLFSAVSSAGMKPEEEILTIFTRNITPLK